MTTLDTIFGGDHPEIAELIRGNDRRLAAELLERLTRPLPTEEVSDWCERNVCFDEPKFRGAFTLKSREYLREPLDLWRRDISNDISDEVICWATRTAKTRCYMGGLAYRIALDPVRALITKPMKHGAGGARNDARTKFIPMLKASPGIQPFVEKCDKNALNYGQQMINGSILDWEGTGSPKQLSGNPDDVVIQDECDGYVLKGNTEAHPSVLADERTKDASNPLRYKSCSPTVEEGVIWQWLMRSDCRRRFVPCPRCSPLKAEGSRLNAKVRYSFPELVERKFFILAWSEQYHVLPNKMPDGTAIPIGFVQWDKAARLKDGSWDLNRVTQTAHVKCPHCGGAIQNFEKEWMDERGQWHPTRTGAPGVAGFQLSSLYVTHDETSWGILARKFLMARESGQTMKGFINNDLAEVDVMQEHGRNQIELVSHPVSQGDWVAQLTADFQKNWPYLWFVVRKWSAFKLLPPFEIHDGRPGFCDQLLMPENSDVLLTCLRLSGSVSPGGGTADDGAARQHRPTGNDFTSPVWAVIAELMRFDSRTGRSPIIDFLIGQKLTGEALVKFYRETAGGDTLEFRKAIYREMSLFETSGKDPNRIRCHRGGDSELVAAGHCALSGEFVWDELKEIIQEFKIGKGMSIPNRCVAIDCGYAERFNREVLRKCYESASEYKYYDPMSKNRPAIFYLQPIHQYCQPAPRDGWLALKGYPMNQRWNHGGIRNELNVNLEDPFFGTANAGTSVVEVLELPSGLFWLRKEDLRQKRSRQVYSVSPEVEWFPKIHQPDGTRTRESNFRLEDYQRQLNEQYYNEEKGVVLAKHGKGGSQSRAHPYHLDDCEVYQIGLASYNEFFEETEKT